MRLVAVALIAMVTACSTAATPSPAPTQTARPSETAAAASTPSPSIAATIAPTAPPTPTPITDLSQVFRPITIGWRPTGPTLMTSTSSAGKFVLAALTFGPSGPTTPAVPLVELAGQPAIRGDGLAIAVSVGTDRGLRLATYDTRSGVSAWVTGPDTNAGPPVWSKDGGFLYYATALPAADFKGAIHRVDARGTNDVEIASLDRFGQTTGLTIDGRGLIWSRGQAGGSVDIIDLISGVNRHLENNAALVSMRARQPRALLIVGGCCAGPGGGSLQVWDDEQLTSREIGASGAVRTVVYTSAVWDPTGTRVAATGLYAATGYDTGSLVIVDPDNGTAQPVADSVDARRLIGWGSEGIVVGISARRSATVEIKLLPTGGGPAVTLFNGSAYVFPVIIRP